MELSVGDRVVVPSLGVGLVTMNASIDIGSEMVPAYRIDLDSDDGAYWIPESQVGEQGLRTLVDEGRIERIWKTMVEAEAPEERANWNRRRKRYQEMMASNEPEQLASLIGELSSVAHDKKDKKQVLSFGERRLLDKAKTLISNELAAASGCTPEAMMKQLEMKLAKG